MMIFLREFAQYGSGLLLPNGISLTPEDQTKMRLIIFRAISNFYKVDKNSRAPIKIGGRTLLPEYLFKAINNRTLLKKIVYDQNGEIVSGVKTKEDLFKFVEDNLYNLFNYKGKYFDSVYRLLSSTSRKGNKLEEEAFKVFVGKAVSKGINVIVESPTVEEDKSGIDGIFHLNGKRYTIQVKPLFKIEDYKIDRKKYIAFCDGVLVDLKTDYLIITDEKQTRVFRSKGIESKGSYFLIPKTNEV